MQPDVVFTVRVEIPNVMRALVLAMAPDQEGRSFTSAKMAIFTWLWAKSAARQSGISNDDCALGETYRIQTQRVVGGEFDAEGRSNALPFRLMSLLLALIDRLRSSSIFWAS